MWHNDDKVCRLKLLRRPSQLSLSAVHNLSSSNLKYTCVILMNGPEYNTIRFSNKLGGEKEDFTDICASGR